MGKYLLAVFALSFLALFMMPVSAANADMPPLPDENMATGAYPTSVNGQITDSVTQNAPSPAGVVSRAQAIKDRIANAVQAGNIKPANATLIKSQIAERIQQATAIRAQDIRQTEAFILQAGQVIGTLNATQKRQLATVVYGFVNSSLDNRVSVANRFEARGLDPAKVEAYSASVDAIKAEIISANSTQERRRLVVQANREWAAFKRDVVKAAAWARIRNATDKAQAVLDKIDALIARLAANGTNTTRLEDIAGRVQGRIDAARQQNITLRQSEWRLAYARDGLAHLANQVRRAVKAQAVEELPEQAEPAELAVEDPVETGQETAATTGEPTTVANATGTQ